MSASYERKEFEKYVSCRGRGVIVRLMIVNLWWLRISILTLLMNWVSGFGESPFQRSYNLNMMLLNKTNYTPPIVCAK